MKKLVIFSVLLLILGISGCGQKLIDDGNGHKQFKDNNGNFIKNDWAEINGKYYYFDMNGYLVTNQWVQDEYYVDDKGAMQTNYWYDDKNGNMYYLGKDGKYTKDTIATIDNNEYAFNPNGVLVKNAPYVKDGVGYFFGNDGKIDKTEGYKSINGTYCYVKDDGSLLVNDWKEDEGKWYYFNDIGLMLKNSFVEGGYYVDENGEMVKNRQIQIGNDKYQFNDEGIGSIITIKTNSGIWEYYKTNKGKAYVNAKRIPTTTNFLDAYAYVAISKEDANIMFQYSDKKGPRWLGGFSSSTKITIEVNGAKLIDSERIKTTLQEGETIRLTDTQYKILVNSLQTSNNKIIISISEDWGQGLIVNYRFTLDAKGFNDVYLNF